MAGHGDGFGDAVLRFTNDVDAAVSRARRAAADAQERVAAFRAENRDVASQVRSGEVRVRQDEVTSDELRQAAAAFRESRGLPVEQFPDVTTVVAEEQPKEPAAASGRGAGRRADDDDDDFSQERIMTRG
jgi:hypothetical protein